MTYAAIAIGANTALPLIVTGGTLTSDSTYYYRTFKSTDSLVVSNASLQCEYLIVGSGGGGAYGGCGGSGGIAFNEVGTILANTYTVTVGAGGAWAGNGNTSSFNSQVADGGPVGSSITFGTGAAGGPGAGSSGSAAIGQFGGQGGLGKSYSSWASATSTGRDGRYAGGGGGGSYRVNYSAPGGTGGGGAGGWSLDDGTSNDFFAPSDGSGRTFFGDAYPNTGGCGGGGGSSLAYSQQTVSFPGGGGSGIVIIRYLKTAVGG